MKIAFFSTKKYDEKFFAAENKGNEHQFTFFEPHLSQDTVALAFGFPAICAFVHDQLNAQAIKVLSEHGCRLIALRCAGFNNVDLKAAEEHNITVVRVPAYSPHAVAEHTLALILTLNRKIHRAHTRVHESNFSLGGLMGFDLFGKTVGIIGTGRIGTVGAEIFKGFGCKILAVDPVENPECLQLGVQYVPLQNLLAQSDIVTLHCPLMPETHHLINKQTIEQMKPGVMLINTSRGAVIDTKAVITALKSGHIGYLGLDVYEEEGDLFFEDLSDTIIQDDLFSRLLTFPNVIITGHQAFFTKEAMESIVTTTLQNVSDFENGRPLPYALTSKYRVQRHDS